MELSYLALGSPSISNHAPGYQVKHRAFKSSPRLSNQPMGFQIKTQLSNQACSQFMTHDDWARNDLDIRVVGYLGCPFGASKNIRPFQFI